MGVEIGGDARRALPVGHAVEGVARAPAGEDRERRPDPLERFHDLALLLLRFVERHAGIPGRRGAPEEEVERRLVAEVEEGLARGERRIEVTAQVRDVRHLLLARSARGFAAAAGVHDGSRLERDDAVEMEAREEKGENGRREEQRMPAGAHDPIEDPGGRQSREDAVEREVARVRAPERSPAGRARNREGGAGGAIDGLENPARRSQEKERRAGAENGKQEERGNLPAGHERREEPLGTAALKHGARRSGRKAPHVRDHLRDLEKGDSKKGRSGSPAEEERKKWEAPGADS